MSEEAEKVTEETAGSLPPDDLAATPVEVPEELTMDSLFEEAVKEAELEQAEKDLLLPKGSYFTVPGEFIGKLKLDKNGRKIISFWGSVVGGTDEKPITGKIGIGFSHIRKNKVDKDSGEDTGIPDFLYGQYLKVVRAFKDAHEGQSPSNVKEIADYLTEYPVRLTIVQTKNFDNMVIGINAIKAA